MKCIWYEMYSVDLNKRFITLETTSPVGSGCTCTTLHILRRTVTRTAEAHGNKPTTRYEESVSLSDSATVTLRDQVAEEHLTLTGR